MSRLTKKIENQLERNLWNNKLNYSYVEPELIGVLNKLGKLEDLMEEYNLESIEDLENLLALQTFKVGGRLNGKSIIAKGILYNQLSDELGCPLDVVFRALNEGVYKVDEDIIFEATLRIRNDEIYLCQPYDDMLLHKVHTKDYQKTWWLKGDKDEKAS